MMKKLLILAVLVLSGAAYADEHLSMLYIGRASVRIPNVRLSGATLTRLFVSEKSCRDFGENIARTLINPVTYTCEPVVIDTKTLKDFAKAQK